MELIILDIKNFLLDIDWCKTNDVIIIIEIIAYTVNPVIKEQMFYVYMILCHR